MTYKFLDLHKYTHEEESTMYSPTLRMSITDLNDGDVSVNFKFDEYTPWGELFERFVYLLRGAGYVIDDDWTEAAINLHRDMIEEQCGLSLRNTKYTESN